MRDDEPVQVEFHLNVTCPECGREFTTTAAVDVRDTADYVVERVLEDMTELLNQRAAAT